MASDQLQSRGISLPAVAAKIYPVNEHILPLMEEELRLRAYSNSTIRTYLGEMQPFLLLIKGISADDLTPDHLRRYFVFCHEKLGLSENTLHSRINALKFYYERVLKRDKFFWNIPRPKKHTQLPKVFSKEEIVSLIRAIGNIKHKAMISLATRAGCA
jgi:integrase/recombinase XerD